MPTNRTLSGLRHSAALLVTVSGLGQIALLWFRELSTAALADVLLGTVYLFIGIGLLGQSRFTLCLAMAVPAAIVSMILRDSPFSALEPLQQARIAADLLVILFAAVVLWQVRNDPSS